METPAAGSHPFLRRPHRTLVGLSVPVLISLVAEPVTGIVDTAFVARLGAAPLAALGAGTVVLAGVFWVFNFLGIGTQTEVARTTGAGRPGRAREICGIALVMAALLGLALMAAGFPAAGPLMRLMGATGGMETDAVRYLTIRLLGAPAVIMTLAAFGALRGMLDMRTPLRIALILNAANAILDPVLIFGLGPVPRLGVAGAAAATVVAQWLGVILALIAIRARLGLHLNLHLRDMARLLVVGRDLVLRTGMLMLFIVLTTRAATRMGPEEGAAHQAIRQVWMLTAMALDAFAAAAQSLVGFFHGAGRTAVMRHVARLACGWGVGTGVVLTAGMLLTQGLAARGLVPPAAWVVFAPAWMVAALSQPLNAVAFATDGIHWGTGDYRFLRNAMLAATGTSALLLVGMEWRATGTLTTVWMTVALWITIRSLFGLLRIWPGIGHSPFRDRRQGS